MDSSTIDKLVCLASQMDPSLVDITGGAPEYNPNLRYLMRKLTEHGHPLQVRTNLTILLEPWAQRYIEVYKDHQVKIVASLPCYEAAEVDSVRGEGTFDQSIRVLKELNSTGYGLEEDLVLDLVYNPEGAFLPPKQDRLEQIYREKLQKEHGVFFNNLITITNMPIGRFSEQLLEGGVYNDYRRLLWDSRNPETIQGLMCRHQISMDWKGDLYDCDFNIALGIPVEHALNVGDDQLDLSMLKERRIKIGDHCFGCTAGQGSSCNGALV